MKKLLFLFFTLLAFNIYSATLTVVQNGTDVNLFWTDHTNWGSTIFYEVSWQDLTDQSDPLLTTTTFQEHTITGLSTGHIYKIEVNSYYYQNDKYYDLATLGPEYFVFGNPYVSTEPRDSEVFELGVGTVASGWWTMITMCNAGQSKEYCTLNIGNQNDLFVIDAGECASVPLSDYFDEEVVVPIDVETTSEKVQCIVSTGSDFGFSQLRIK